MKSKKGQALGGLPTGAIAILILIIVVAIGATALQSIRDTQLDTGTASAIESYTVDNTTAETLTNARCIDTSVVIINATNGSQTFASGNYTVACSASASTITWDTGTGNNSAVNASYNYNIDVFPEDYNITTAGLTSLGTYSDFFTVIVVIIVFAVIIGLFAIFATRGRQRI